MRPQAGRLRKLEREGTASSIQPCSVCGGHPDAQPRLTLCFVNDPGADHQPEYCPDCKRRLVIQLSFDEGIEVRPDTMTA